MNFISVILSEMEFQTGMRFSCEENLPEAKRISADSLDIKFNMYIYIIIILFILGNNYTIKTAA